MQHRARTAWLALSATLAALGVLVAGMAGPARAVAAPPSASSCDAGTPGGAVHVASVSPDERLTGTWRAFGDSGGGWANRGGWAAADGTYSATLPGHRVAWMFNDTFLGPVNADESLPPDAGFVHNSIVLAGRDGLPRTTVTGGTQAAPESLVGDTSTAPPTDPSGTNDKWYWNADGIVDGGKLRLFELAQGPSDDPPPFNFAWTNTDIATFSTHGLHLEKVTPTYAAGNVQWGVELMRCGGWIYVYGVENVPLDKYMHVARAPVGHLTDQDWQFFTGTGWSSDPTASARVLRNVGSSYSVTPVDGQFLLTTSDATLGHQIYVATASSPTGPFVDWTPVYTAPEANGNIYAPYNIAAHPELSRPGELVISYNVNASKIGDLYADANNNRARYLDLHLEAGRP